MTRLTFDPIHKKGRIKMKFAYLILGEFVYPQDSAAIHGETAQIIGVSNLEEACAAAKKLAANGVGCIELCGAFGENGAKKIIEATEHKIPIGYVIHLPEQKKTFEMAFG